MPSYSHHCHHDNQQNFPELQLCVHIYLAQKQNIHFTYSLSLTKIWCSCVKSKMFTMRGLEFFLFHQLTFLFISPFSVSFFLLICLQNRFVFLVLYLHQHFYFSVFCKLYPFIFSFLSSSLSK